MWIAYLLLDRAPLAWASVAILATAALLGSTMLARWIPVYRAPVATHGPAATADMLAVPAERNFPVIVVLGHGVLGVTTFALVLLTVLGAGES